MSPKGFCCFLFLIVLADAAGPFPASQANPYPFAILGYFRRDSHLSRVAQCRRPPANVDDFVIVQRSIRFGPVAEARLVCVGFR